ncbi:recombination mediator RecR [Olsenella sp. YH-ols2221]|uniref:recombination mediator RecR n=1 Tax=Olsenella kribbiana TaxID=3115221 RepID=UPI002EDA8FDB|nr:recombination mediator RecR [Olsenella sp.]
MAERTEHALQRLLDELGRLPGIGPKSAQRIAYYLLEADAKEAERLADAILDVKREVHFCPICFNYATGDTCDICADSTRTRSEVCVVAEPRDVEAIERTGSYHGLYHVLGGVISPMDKIGPAQLHVRELMARLADGEIQEVILATSPNVEGETTASYLSRQIKPLGITVSRLASGLPVGGDLEYADEVTLGHAIEERRVL